MSIVKIGDVFESKSGQNVVVTDYKNAKQVQVKYQDKTGYVTTYTSGNLKKGNFKNPYKPLICEVGYIGVGAYNSGSSGATRKSYLCWRSMLIRCYSKEYVEAHPSYEDCSVCEEWHNFQNFAEWYEKQPNAGKKSFDLDKDLKILGNKVYSPDTCSFLPQEINKLLCDRGRFRGDLPRGVCKHGIKFKASINIEGKRVHIGVFKSQEDAYLAYTQEKEKYVRRMANKYREFLHPQVYENLLNWSLDAIKSKDVV